MKCDLANMLRQARGAIDPKRDRYGYAFSLEQLEDHVRQVRAGTVALDEFADFYMLRPPPAAIPPAASSASTNTSHAGAEAGGDMGGGQ